MYICGNRTVSDRQVFHQDDEYNDDNDGATAKEKDHRITCITLNEIAFPKGVVTKSYQPQTYISMFLVLSFCKCVKNFIYSNTFICIYKLVCMYACVRAYTPLNFYVRISTHYYSIEINVSSWSTLRQPAAEQITFQQLHCICTCVCVDTNTHW